MPASPIGQEGVPAPWRRISPRSGGTMHCLGADFVRKRRTARRSQGQCLSCRPFRCRLAKTGFWRKGIGPVPAAWHPDLRQGAIIRNADAALDDADLSGRRRAMGLALVPVRGTRQEADQNQRTHAPGKTRHERSCLGRGFVVTVNHRGFPSDVDCPLFVGGAIHRPDGRIQRPRALLASSDPEVPKQGLTNGLKIGIVGRGLEPSRFANPLPQNELNVYPTSGISPVNQSGEILSRFSPPWRDVTCWGSRFTNRPGPVNRIEDGG